MYVRLADFDFDAPAIMNGARDFVARINFAEWISDEEDELADAVSRILALDDVEIAVAVENNTILGGLGMIYTPYLWNPKLTMAEELFFWTAQGAPPTTALRLLRFVRRRSVERSAGIIAFKALNTSPPGLDKVYRASGLRQVEATYMGDV